MRYFAAIFLGLLASGAPGTEDLFPGHKGSVWEYRVSEGGSEGTARATLTVDSEKAGTRTVTIVWTAGKQKVRTETYQVFSNGVRRTRSGSNGEISIEPGIPLIQYPMQVGKTWDWSGTVIPAEGPSRKATARVRVTGRESIATKAGSFSAFRVEMKLLVAGEGLTPATYWFAPGVGMVKEYTAVRTADNKKFETAGLLTRYTLK